MTLEAFVELLLAVDPEAVRYDRIGQDKENYTVFCDYREDMLCADDEPAETVLHVQVDRYTKDEQDSIAEALKALFEETAEISCTYEKDFDPVARVIRHLFDCEIAA